MQINSYFPILVLMLSFPFSSTTLFAEVTKEKSPSVAISVAANQATIAKFVPPEGWRFAEIPPSLPNVHVMVVGKGEHEFPPSIHLGSEKYSGTLKEYLKVIKSINDAQGSDWKDLGTIQTASGPASLSQLQSKSQWGEIKMMHVITIKDETVYILTTAALKDEFPKYYKDFFKTMRSLNIENEDPSKIN